MDEQLPKKSEEKFSQYGYVSLPFSEDHFKEFIVGLLGKPQTIDNIIEGSFEIELGNIQDLYELITQRISQQNDSNLIQFLGRIVFDNGSSVLLNSIDALLSYREIRPLISIEVHITLQYLIKFENKKVPERQEVNISFISSSYSEDMESNKNIDIASPTFLISRLFRYKQYNQGYIQYNIKHTARTWGVDIDLLLSNYFASILLIDG